MSANSRRTGQDTTRQPSVPLGVRGGHEAVQPRPPGRGLREQGDPQRRLHHVGATAYGCTRPTGSQVRRADGGDGDVDAEDGADAGGLGEADRARDGVPVGQRERRHPTLCSTLHEGIGEGSAVAGGVTGGDVQMTKSTAAHLLPLVCVPPLTVSHQGSTITKNMFENVEWRHPRVAPRSARSVLVPARHGRRGGPAWGRLESPVQLRL